MSYAPVRMCFCHGFAPATATAGTAATSDGPRRRRKPMNEIPRDRWDRPLIIPPNGGQPVAYTRVSTLAKALTT